MTESYKTQIDTQRMPKHIAIIMDGNGRWAKQRGQERVLGHFQGIKSVRAIIESSVELKLGYITLYTFSTENWKRPQSEVDSLMELLVDNIERETPTFHENNVRLAVIGDIKRLPQKAQDKLYGCIEDTAINSGLTLVLALSYSSQQEMIEAVQNMANEVKDGTLSVQSINADTISQHLNTKGIPDPDLIIRTGGELRLSNFLLWQAAYAELYFTPVLWPDFGKEELYKAIVDYQGRERRYGMTSEQL